MTPIKNVVIVVVDALRTDRLGVYGNERGLTPNLDKFAEESTVFENVFSCTNATDPSITSIHSGRYPITTVYHHGHLVSNVEKRRVENVPLLPELLAQTGHRTVATGRPLSRWHERGFDTYPTPGAVGRQKRRRLGELIERIHPRLRSLAASAYEGFEHFRSGDGDDNSNAIDDLLAVLDDEPFYGFVHLMDTHTPYEPDPDLVDELLAEHDYPNRDIDDFFMENADRPYIDGHLREKMLTERDREDGLARFFARYDGAVREADAAIGKLIDGLSNRGRLEDTAVIVTSDHGESLDEHGIYFDHHGLYDVTIRVPLLIATPKTNGSRRDELVQLCDLFPTITDWLDIEEPAAVHGDSLDPLLHGSEDWTPREFVFVEEAQAQRRVGIRTRTHKYIQHQPDDVLAADRGSSLRCDYCDMVHGEEKELYDLEQDPRESANIAETNPERCEELANTLNDFLESLEYPSDAGNEVEYEHEDEVMKRLEDLGYR